MPPCAKRLTQSPMCPLIIAGKGPLSNSTTAAQPWRRELALMPLSGPRCPAAQCVDEQAKRWRPLAAARVVEVIARIARAPILKHALETALREMGLRHVLGHIG
jgi:hypothetical protein